MADLMLRIVGKDDASQAFNQVASSSKRLDNATRQLSTSQTHSHRAFSATKRILTGIATSYAAIKVGQFAKESIQAASDVHEAMTATNQVFKKQSAQIKAWSKGSAADFGQTRTQALSTARQFGTLFKSAGVGGQKLADYSTGLTELAGDIASFNNVPVQQAIDDLTSGLTGQVEPMRKYGVFLSANALKAEAMRMGIADGTATLTDQQRTLAAYNLILRQTGVTSDKFAQQFGDFDRTAGGFANQTRILTANWAGFKGAFGEAILPLATGAIKGLNQIIPALSQSLSGGGLGKTLESWGPKAESFFTSLRTNLPEISGIAGDFADAAGIIGNGLKGVFDAFNSLPDGVRQGLIVLGTAAATMKMLNRAAGGGGMTAFGNAVESIPHAVLRAGMGTAAAEAVKAAFGNRIGTMQIQAGVVNVNGGKVNGGGPGAAGTAGKSAGMGALATAGLTAAGLAISAAIVMAIKSGIDSKYGDTPAGTRNRQNDIRSSTLGQGSQRGQGMDYKPVERYKTGIDSAIASQKRLNVETARWNGLARAFADKQFIKKDQGRSLDAQADRYKALAKAVKEVPDRKSTRVSAPGADESRGKVKGLGGAVGALRGKTVKVAESGADPSRGRVNNLKGAIGALRGKSVAVGVNGADNARTQVYQLVSAINSLRDKTVTTYYREVKAGQVRNAAGGGYISGPGGPTDDAIPARLSNGEYVVRAASVRRYGRAFLDAVNAGSLTGLAKGTPPGKKAVENAKAIAKELRQANAEANRQQKIAAQIEARGLGGQVISYLGGMSSRAALQALGSTKNAGLRRAAKRANSLSDLQARRDAEAQAKRDAADAAKQAADDAAQAAADAAQRQADAEDAALDRINQLRDAVEQAASSYRSFASIATTSVTDVADAQARLTDSNNAVIEAQKKMDLAGSDRERAAAANDLARAIGAQQQAQQNLAAAGAPTTGSIRGNMASKLQKLRDFNWQVQTLKQRGLNPVTLAELIQMGPDQGYDFAKALLDGGLADINTVQNQITAESASLGYFQTGVNAASSSMTGYAAAQAAGLVTGGVVMAPAPVTITLDGQVLAEAVIAYNRQMGR